MRTPYIQKQLKAIKLAIGALERERRAKYAAGEHAYQRQGIRDFTFADEGHKHYAEYTEAIRQLQDLEEIFTDEPAIIEPEARQMAFGEAAK
jgi:hypothetical protein